MGLDQAGLPELRLSIDPMQTTKAFEDIINIPAKSKHEKCWIVVFDEFQEIEKLNGESFDRLPGKVVNLRCNAWLWQL
jgi:hypothetical protein